MRLALGEILELRGSFPFEEAPVAAEDRPLWQALSVCRPQAASLELACRISGLSPVEAAGSLGRLIASRNVDALDAEHVRVADIADKCCELRRAHAETVEKAMPDYLTEIPSALDFACENDWPFAQRLGQRAADHLRQVHRTAEAAEVLRRMIIAAERDGLAEAAKHFEWELSWLQSTRDRVQRPIVSAEQLLFTFTLP